VTELLLELFSEEIPARMQARAAEDLVRLLSAEIAPVLEAPPHAFFGPRRIGLTAHLKPSVTTAGKEERGPRIGAPDQALDGFLRKHGATREALKQEGQFWVLSKPGETVAARDLVARAVPTVLRAFPWPKSMRWGGSSAFVWVRPLKRILCVLDGEVVPFDLRHGEDDGHGLVSGNETEGHRVMASGAFAVKNFSEYESGLRARKVVLDAKGREQRIREGIDHLAAQKGLNVVPDEGLVAEVAGLVEWPVPLLARIDGTFMDLPPEVMRTTMRVNQRYFSTIHRDGSPAPYFAVVANIEASDGGAAIVAGNERVLRARLSDARFFWDQDRRQSLEDFLPKLESVVFHAKLGTQGARVRRLERLAAAIAPMVGADAALAQRAGYLAKADLASGMVGEFPELQGIMGRYYARHASEDARVAEAIGAHYRPLGPGDAVPSEPVSVAVALADKIDQLVGFFAVGEKPTGSGDPFALRRAALGVIRIIRENGLRLSFFDVLDASMALWVEDAKALRAARAEALEAEVEARAAALGLAVLVDAEPVAIPNLDRRVSATAFDVVNFLAERLRVQMRAEGLRHDVVAAALGSGGEDDLVRLLMLAEALKALVESETGANLLAAYKRAANILRIEEKKDGPHSGPIDAALLDASEEKALAAALDQAEPAAADALRTENFSAAMSALASLRAPVDAFFDRVTVNADQPDLRKNRLRLLARLRAAMDAVADFSKIEG